jgi:outer membrane protein OmpA-like peptidoglycan-associated protein/Tol biopolymer transport system component
MLRLPSGILTLLAVLFFTTAARAQMPTLPSGESTSKKATGYFKEAMGLYQVDEFDKALVEVGKALKADSNYIDALLLAAELNSLKGNRNISINQYEKIISVNAGFFLAYYFLAEETYMNSEYEKAIKAGKNYLQYRENNPQRNMKVRRIIKSCEFSIQAIKNPVSFTPINLGENVNSFRDEYTPGITMDGDKLIFTRLLIDKDSVNMGNFGNLSIDDKMRLQQTMHEDFYVSQKVNGAWGKARNFGPPINTPENEGQPFFSSDGSILFFTRCTGGGRSSDCNIYFTFLDGDRWAPPVKLGAPVNTREWESQPSISFDGKTLYFASNRDGGFGEIDLFESTYANGKWSEPKNLGPKINTPGRDQNPCIAKDNNTLYFNSDGHPSIGGVDLYVSRRQPDGEWGEPVNLGYPINTSGNELTLSISGDGEYAYYVSDKLKDGKGGFDIYYFKLPQNMQPQKTNYLKAVVFEDGNKAKKLDAKVELIDLETGKPVIESYSNKVTGEFLICLPLNKNYALNVSKNGYLFYSENFSLKEPKNNEPYVMEIPLKPIKAGQSVVLKNVFFDTDKYDLKPESKAELNKLVAFLNANPTLKIELSGHTDTQGNKQSNIVLSQNRAKAVMDFLIANGITKERLTAKGYGDAQPIAENTTEKGRAMNRRTEFKILN